MAFDRIAFFQVCMDIEKYLGYLRANELATEYLETLQAQRPSGETAELYQEYYVRLRDWSTPCPDGKWKVRAHESYGGLSAGKVLIPFDATEEEKSRIDREVKANLETSYKNGLNWADGLAMNMNELCGQFSHVDVDAMAVAVLDLMDNVTAELAIGARQQWTDIGKMLQRWQGEGATAFYLFHENYASAISQFAQMSAQVGAGFAGATAVIHGTQEIAMKFVASVREALEGMLGLWVECGLTTPPNPSYDIDVGRIMEVAGGVWKLIRLIPPVAAATEGVNTAVEAVGAIKDMVGPAAGGGTVDTHPEPHAFKDWSANALYSEITQLLHQDIYLKYVEAMDHLYNGQAMPNVDDADQIPFRAQKVEQAMEAMQGSRGEWELPAVPPKSLNENGAPYGY